MSEGLMSGGGGKEFKYPGDLLWTNPTPSTFAAQTLTLDTSKYEVIRIVISAYKEDPAYQNGIKQNYIIDKNDGQTFHILGCDYSTDYFMIRKVRNITDSALTFDIGLHSDASHEAYAVPYQIYGVVKK